MLRQISRPTLLILLEQLTPSLVTRAQAFSHSTFTSNPLPKLQDGPLIQSRIREKIMAQTQSRRALLKVTKDKFNVTLAEIGMAVKRKDLITALQLWQGLEDHRKILSDSEACRLPDSTIRELHNLFMSHSLSEMASHPWADAMMKTAKDFALQAAKYYSAEAFSMLMVHYINSGDSQTVLRLYDEFCQTFDAEDVAPPASQVEEESSLALIEENDYELERVNPGRALVVIGAVTAHAMNDSFKAALAAHNSFGITIRVHHKKKFLRYLQDNAPLSRKVKSYLDRLIVASLVNRPPSLSRHVMNMGHPKAVSDLQSFYRKIIDGIFGEEPYIAAHPSTLSDSKLVSMTESGWTSFQTSFIRCERIDLAAKVWDDLAAAGIKPGVSMWTGLLDTYADLRNSKQAMATWNMMLQQDTLPDHLSYRAVVSALFDDGNAIAALERFKEYQNVLGGRDGLGIPVYNTVLRGLLRINRFDDASGLLKDMQSHGPEPDLFSYNTFLGYYGRQKNFKGLADVLSHMSTSKIQGDVVTFSTILSALLSIGRKDASTTIMSLMRKQGIKPNVATYTAVIDSQMREQTQANFEAALALLDKMEQDDGIKPNEVTYTAILAGLYRAQWLSREKADSIRKEIVAKMRGNGVTFRLPTYHILIRAALDSPDEMAYMDALGLIQEMKNNGIPRVGNTWYILLGGLMTRGLWDVAYEMAGTILGSGHEPNATLRNMIHQIHKQRINTTL